MRAMQIIEWGKPLLPFKMMSIEGSYVGTLPDLKELLDLAQVPGRVVMTHPSAPAR